MNDLFLLSEAGSGATGDPAPVAPPVRLWGKGRPLFESLPGKGGLKGGPRPRFRGGARPNSRESYYQFFIFDRKTNIRRIPQAPGARGAEMGKGKKPRLKQLSMY
jgi:hypothetical protein